MSKFPNLLAAVELRAKHEGQVEGSDLWAIGDALIKDVGPPAMSAPGADIKSHSKEIYHDGSHAKIKDASEMLIAKGYPNYSLKYLINLRAVARLFPRESRHVDLSWSVHDEAGDAKFLDWAITAAKKHGIKKLSKRDVIAMRDHLRDLEDEKREHKQKKAQEKKRRAKTEKERAEAEEEIAESMGPPKGGFTPPDKKDETELMLIADIMRIDLAAKQLGLTLRDHQQKLRKMEENLTEDLTESLMDHYATVVQTAQQLVEFLNLSKRNRFQLIKGGKHA